MKRDNMAKSKAILQSNCKKILKIFELHAICCSGCHQARAEDFTIKLLKTKELGEIGVCCVVERAYKKLLNKKHK
jgi:hypothetical protein